MALINCRSRWHLSTCHLGEGEEEMAFVSPTSIQLLSFRVFRLKRRDFRRPSTHQLSLEPLEGSSSKQRLSTYSGSSKRSLPILVPGKFDAFHLGHRELARIAAQYGSPVLLTFSGMASELSWKPRASVLAPVDRSRVLYSWRRYVGTNIGWKVLPFSDIRRLEPVEFVKKMKDMFDAGGFVCGENWRFGYRAKGNTQTLIRICENEGMTVQVVPPVVIDGVAVSSTRVRGGLERGEVELVEKLLGRPHRLVGYLMEATTKEVRCGEFVNQVPGDGVYHVIVRVLGRNRSVRTTARIHRDAKERSQDETLSECVEMTIQDASSIFCEQCEVYVDFLERIEQP